MKFRKGDVFRFKEGVTEKEVRPYGFYWPDTDGKATFDVLDVDVMVSHYVTQVRHADGSAFGAWSMTSSLDDKLELVTSNNIDNGTDMKKKNSGGEIFVKIASQKDLVIGDIVRVRSGVECPDRFEGEATLERILPAQVYLKRRDGVRGGGTDGAWIFLTENIHLLEKQQATQTSVLDISAMEKVIMPEKNRKEIISVLKQHKNAKKLFEDWGLGEVIEYGKGMTFLFYGPPGTGKTWAAHCIAKAVGKELLIISAAEIQSSEPGGANRAIQQAFAEAKSSGKVLFIDECDSLVQSRTNLGMVLGSEVNSLLTEIEKYEGIAVLATNMVENLDEALERRISLMVEFPKPKRAERRLIWDRMLPKKMPLGKDVDKEELSKPKLTGGQIKNIILNAARLALSEDKEEVSKMHFDAAIDRLLGTSGLMGNDNWTQDSREDASKSVDRRSADRSTGKGKTKTRSADIDISTDKEGVEADESELEELLT